MTRKSKIKIVIDVNWFISSCINKNSRRILYYKILRNKDIQVYFSAELFDEFRGVMNRDKFRKFITLNQVRRFSEIVTLLMLEVQINTIPTIIRDAKDNYLLGICESCNADFLITGDNDLLILENYNRTHILTMNQFLIMLETLHKI